MDVFTLRDRLIREYREYIRGFVAIKEPVVRRKVEEYFDEGYLWPEPLVQLNPAFQPGRWVHELVAEKVLHSECDTVFRRRENETDFGKPIRLHHHQEQALAAAATGKSYVLTTGTGSGKSLAYFVPIVDRVLRNGSGKGIKAIVIYPMNALCNSQEEALRRFLQWGHPNLKGPVTFAKYTGQEDQKTRDRIKTNPPDILLTNFVMLELILTRREELDIVGAAQGLEFLVLDELHTYRGRQGADVAMLVRRVRDRCGAPTMRCVGTSATLAASGTREQHQAEIAQVASRLFGTEVPTENVIGESLQRATVGGAASPDDLSLALQISAPFSGLPYKELARNPLAVWSETAFGLKEDEQGRLERRSPRTLGDAAQELSGITGVHRRRCEEQLRSLLMAGYHARHPETGFPLFAFRLHQFVSRGDTVYGTPEPPEERYLSFEGQQFVPGDRSRRLYPMAFCRVCGQDHLVVSLVGERQLEPRKLDEEPGGDGVEGGYLVIADDKMPNPLEDPSVLPEDWTEIRRGELVVRSSARHNVPRPVRVAPDGRVLGDMEEGGSKAWFMPDPFRFCFGCGINYTSGREKDFTRLAGLSSEGRSTATTIISMAIVRALREDNSLPDRARKLLSFTDNRQDASLQAGHFNDFVQVTLLRSAILSAVAQAGADGLSHDEIAQKVVKAMGLDREEYASDPAAEFSRRSQDEALREVAGYLVYHDLRRGWRVTSPNLEQVGLLHISYDDLPELCAADKYWADLHPVLAQASPSDRQFVCRALLNHLRRGLAIKVQYLEPEYQERIRQRSYQYLKAPWRFEEADKMREANVLQLGGDRQSRKDDITITTRSLLGRFLRRGSNWPATALRGQQVPANELDALVADLVKMLVLGGHLVQAEGVKGAYQLDAGKIRWQLGDGTVEHDPTRVSGRPEGEVAVNQFFAQLYHVAASNLRQLEAREHTAQVPAAERQAREHSFGEAKLPVLYCSPTMELGVDIQDLNAVNMRNVPPTPANYAQRSGRAGRSGQPALVLTYCTSTSPHDQYYFRRPGMMVAGAVVPPRLDLANEELIQAHVHAVWLAETGQPLFSAVSDLLDLSDSDLAIKADVRHYIDQSRFQASALKRCLSILGAMSGDIAPTSAPWYTSDWLEKTVHNAPKALDRAADRWRHLYRTAKLQQQLQHDIVADPLRTQEDRKTAQRLREEAETQIELLTRGRQDVYSDFYSYRYFATEGFLPGYNFPRLPVTAYIPGTRRKKGEEDYISRARFVAISEFGPRSIVYHEGNRYRVSRVVLPREEAGGRTRSAQFCRLCGYGHFAEQLNADTCDRCGTPLNASTAQRFDSLLKLESVSTYRVDRISCDEEERLRMGYEVRTIFRFATKDDGSPSVREVSYLLDGEPVAKAAYGPSTTLWRVNLGWNRRKEKNLYGFMLDMERGIWSKMDEEPDAAIEEPDPLASPASPKQRVIPFVEDHRNALLFKLEQSEDVETMLSLMYALKRGIEARYQLEDSELACEPLPDAQTPRSLLFYEAAEGGAGVLVRLAEEPGALAAVAREALAVCHFDPDDGSDRGKAERATEECEAACYDCLLSYSNQRHYQMLDRKLLPELLLELSRSMAEVGAGGTGRESQLEVLLRRCESDLERDFVNWLNSRGLRLPDVAQAHIEGMAVRPDFLYEGEMTCVYVDGEPHRFPERQARDAAANAALANAGWTVVRVQGPESWPTAAEKHVWLFGVLKM